MNGKTGVFVPIKKKNEDIETHQQADTMERIQESIGFLVCTLFFIDGVLKRWIKQRKLNCLISSLN